MFCDGREKQYRQVGREAGIHLDVVFSFITCAMSDAELLCNNKIHFI